MPNIKQTFSLPTPFEQQVAEANRRQKLAELMQQEASTPLESQMVSGRVVPTSPLLALTKMLQGYMGGKFASQADEQRAAAEKSDMASAMDWMKNVPTSQQGYTEGAAAGLTPNQASAINLPSTVPGRPSPAAGMTPEQAAITNTPDQPSAPREANIGTMPVSAAERENYLLGGAIGQSPRARMLAQALLAKKPETPEYYDAVPVTVGGVTKMVQYSKTGGAPRAVEGQKYERPEPAKVDRKTRTTVDSNGNQIHQDYNFNPGTGEEVLVGQQYKGTPKAPDPNQVKPFQSENVLRDEFNNLTSPFRLVQDAYSKIKTTSNNGAGDMSLLYSYVKMLDPGSAVKEGEFETAAASGSFGQRVQGAVQRILSGERLPTDLRESFKKEAEGLYAAQRGSADRVRKQYYDIAIRNGLNPKNVLVDYTAPEAQSVPKPYDNQSTEDAYQQFKLRKQRGAPGQGTVLR
jgi:hypothetical protein